MTGAHHVGKKEGFALIELLRISLEDRPGQLHKVITTISKAGVDMKALSLMHHGTNHGEALLLVADLARAQKALVDAGATPSIQPAVVVEVPDRAGGLASVLEATSCANLSVNDLFTFVTRVEGKALAVATFDDGERAEELLRKAGIRTFDQQTLINGTPPANRGPHLLDDYLGGSFFW